MGLRDITDEDFKQGRGGELRKETHAAITPPPLRSSGARQQGLSQLIASLLPKMKPQQRASRGKGAAGCTPIPAEPRSRQQEGRLSSPSPGGLMQQLRTSPSGRGLLFSRAAVAPDMF